MTYLTIKHKPFIKKTIQLSTEERFNAVAHQLNKLSLDLKKQSIELKRKAIKLKNETR